MRAFLLIACVLAVVASIALTPAAAASVHRQRRYIDPSILQLYTIQGTYNM